MKLEGRNKLKSNKRICKYVKCDFRNEKGICNADADFKTMCENTVNPYDYDDFGKEE